MSTVGVVADGGDGGAATTNTRTHHIDAHAINRETCFNYEKQRVVNWTNAMGRTDVIGP